MNITVLPYLDKNIVQQQQEKFANEKRKELLNEFQNALAAANSYLDQLSQKSTPAEDTVVVNNDTQTNDSIQNTTPASTSTCILDCPEELDNYFTKAAQTYQVDINLLKAIGKTESAFQKDATSKAGAMGIMQLMPTTASSLGVSDAYDPEQNIMGGAKLISQLLEKYQGNVSLALAAYNAGSNRVDACGGIPEISETQNYVKKVLEYYETASDASANATKSSIEEMLAMLKQSQ